MVQENLGNIKMAGYIEKMEKKQKHSFAVNDWTACKGCADTYSKNSDMPNPFPYEGYSSDASPTSVYLQSGEGSVVKMQEHTLYQ